MNGYTNQSTWNANRWYGDQISDYVEHNQEYFREISISEMADDLESFCWDISGMDELPIGFVREAASQEWEQINWIELAERYMPAMEDSE